MKYDFSRFSTQSFERFAQALAMSHFGAGTQIFGAGPDGAREATYSGTSTSGVNNEPWDGYVVVQAKYKSETGTQVDDLEWLKAQADGELKKFTSARRLLKCPEYYVLVTNIKLTPGAANSDGKYGGTLDEMNRHLEGWKILPHLKQIVVWHIDVLSALLDAHPFVKRSYAAWTTTSDVLNAILSTFEQPSFQTVINRVVRDELKDHRGIRTQDSGQSLGVTVQIDDVFVDLPLDPETVQIHDNEESFAIDSVWENSTTSPERLNVADDDEDDSESFELIDPDWGEPVNLNVVNQIMARMSDKLDHQPSRLHGRSSIYRTVIMGGPGQGKSTIGQFLSQLLRAQLVLSSGSATPEVISTAKVTVARAEAEGIRTKTALRFPIHISLPRYADIIADLSQRPKSILRYIAEHFGELADEAVDPSVLREWLAVHPSLVVLDGLDEVPRTGNRGEVIRAIERLVADLHEAQADTMVIVTSRPQGYINDLDSRHWSHWELADLDPPNAMRFSERLAEVVVSDRVRRKEIVKTLRQASMESSTAPLMVSPLQITLLFVLVLTRNDIPQDRWTLFERHYLTLRDREISKGGPNGDLIRDHIAAIDRIHFDAGFILQLRAEKQGNASAHFTIEEMQRLILRVLKSYIVDEVRAEEVALRLRDIATTRLVFLGDRNEGRISFDVRSIQEFMAAARIMISPESKIKNRLRAISVNSHWSNVFRIACSKVYAQTQLHEFSDELLAIIDSIDNGDPGDEYRIVRAGARHALSLLLESTAGAREDDRVKLMVRAARILEIDSPELCHRIASLADDVTSPPLQGILQQHLNEGQTIRFRNTLLVLISIIRRKEHPLKLWALEVLKGYSPGETIKWEDLSSLPLFSTNSGLSKSIVEQILFASSPAVLRRRPRFTDAELSLFAFVLSDFFSLSETPLPVIDSGEPVYGLEVVFRKIESLAGLELSVPALPERDLGWDVLVACAAFSLDPSESSLANVVNVAIGVNLKAFPISDMPWPAAWCLNAIAKDGGGADLAGAILRGEHGTPQSWTASEAAWLESGVELEAIPFCRQPESIASASLIGPPGRAVRRQRHSPGLSARFIEMGLGQPIDKRLECLFFSAFCCAGVDEAINIISSLDSELMAAPWDGRTVRRMVNVAMMALQVDDHFSAVQKIIPKLDPTGRGYLFHGSLLSPGMIRFLKDPKTAGWAASTIVGHVPFGQAKLDFTDLIDPRFLVTPENASADERQAFAQLRALSGATLPTDVQQDAEDLVRATNAQPPEAAIRLVRSAQQNGLANQNAVSVACEAAKIAFDKGIGHQSSLISVLNELLVSRPTQLDDPACLAELGLPVDVRDAA